MTTDALSLTASRKHFNSTVLLGTLGMIASPLLFLIGLIYGFSQLPSNPVTGLMGLIFVLGWICSAIGVRELRATGQGAAAKILFFLQLIGLLLAASQQIQEIIFEHPETNGLVYAIADIAWPLSMLFMLVVGAFVLKAGVWRGWRRWSVLFCGLALPSALVLSVFAGKEPGGFLFGMMTTICFMTLGNAVRTSFKLAVLETRE